jgi:hypothetical protein
MTRPTDFPAFSFHPANLGNLTLELRGPQKRLEALRERRARIDAEIEQLEAQLDAQERAGQKGAEVLEVEPARGGGSYVLQKVRCGKPTCRCARPGGELHGPYWYHYWKKDGRTKSRYVGKSRHIS